jgi:hypothetical protein
LYLIPVMALTAAMVGCPPTDSGGKIPSPYIAAASPSVTTAGPSVTTADYTVPNFYRPSVTTAEYAVPDFSGAPVAAVPAGVKLVPIPLELPAPAFRGTPKPQNEPNLEEPLGKPRPPFLAPEGTINLAGGKAVTCSDPAPVAGEVDFITDGDKEASDFGYLELRPGSEWVQVDLGQKATVYAVLVWHNHAEARVYRDVIVQVGDDPDFLDAVTVFNNDYDNSSGMGVGPDKGYVETSEGKLIDCRGVEGRYVRFYSKGNHVDNKNHYTEVEVFGRPAA